MHRHLYDVVNYIFLLLGLCAFFSGIVLGNTAIIKVSVAIFATFVAGVYLSSKS
jgi:hypothetical protein